MIEQDGNIVYEDNVNNAFLCVCFFDTGLEMMSLTDPLSSADMDPAGSLSLSSDTRPKSFLHDEMYEFNQIFSELVASPQRRYLFRDPLCLPAFQSPGSPSSPAAVAEAEDSSSSVAASILRKAPKDETNVSSHGLLRIESAPLGFQGHEPTSDGATDSVPSFEKTFQEGNHSPSSEPVSCILSHRNEDVVAELRVTDTRTHSSPRRHSEGSCVTLASSSSTGRRSRGFSSLDALECNSHPGDVGKICDPMNEVIYRNKHGNLLQ